MAEWETPGKGNGKQGRRPPQPEGARATDSLPELHPEQHWAPWETPSVNPGRVSAEQIPTGGSGRGGPERGKRGDR